MKMEKQPIWTESLRSAYSCEPIKTRFWLPGGGVFKFCLPCFVFLARTGSHIPAVPLAPFLGRWPGSGCETGNCGKLRRSGRSWQRRWGRRGKGGAAVAQTRMFWKPQRKVAWQKWNARGTHGTESLPIRTRFKTNTGKQVHQSWQHSSRTSFKTFQWLSMTPILITSFNVKLTFKDHRNTLGI